MQVSVIVPVFNEVETLPTLLERVRAVPGEREVLVVDDGSRDGSAEFLRGYRAADVRVFFHSENRGKGAAVGTALAHASGDVVLVQDADLEYDPEDYPRLLAPIAAGEAEVVYGTRFSGGRTHGSFIHYLGNRALTLATNLLYGSRLTDMETCYKVFRRELCRGLTLRSRGFGFDPELTAHFLRRGLEIREVPVSYTSRTIREGKKIRFADALVALWTLVRCRLRPAPVR